MQPPIQCVLRRIDPEQRARHAECLQAVRAATRERRDLPDGYALRLDHDAATFVTAAEWITLERRCCGFLTFGLEWTADATWLSLTGGDGVKEFLGRLTA